MKIKLSCILVCLCFVVSLSAQTRSELLDAYEAKKYDDAIVIALKMLEKSPNNAETNRICGKAYFNIERMSDALKYQEKSVELSDFKGGYFHLIATYIRLGYEKEAMDAIDKLIEIDSKYKHAYIYRAMVNSLFYRKEEAMADYERYPDYAFSYYNMSILHYQLEEYEESEKAMMKFLKTRKKPYPADVLMYLEEVRMEKDPSYKISKKFLRKLLVAYNKKAIENRYDHLNLYNRADCYALLGEKELARQDYLRSLDLINEIIADVPDAWLYYKTRGNIYKALDEKEKAIKDYEFVLEKCPGNIRVMNSMRKLLEAK